MDNQSIAKLLRNIAACYTIKNEAKYRFQIIAYQRASDTIEHLNTEIKDILESGENVKIPNIGPSIIDYIKEFIKFGKVKHFEDVKKDIPEVVFQLMEIPTFGPKKAYKLTRAFNLNTEGDVIEHLTNLAKRGEIAKLEGFGEKSQQDILQAISEYKLGITKSSRMVLPYAFELSKKIIGYMKKSSDAKEVYPLGSLRRMVSTIGDIDIAVSSNNPGSVIGYFTKFPGVTRIIEKGDKTASILLQENRQIDLMVQPPGAFGALFAHFTGSKEHNIALREFAVKKGLSLSEYGIKEKKDNFKHLNTFKSEEEFYKYIGLEFIPPEIRENKGEIELARTNSLPQLIKISDIKGDLHLHSNYNLEPSHDLGQNSIEEILEKAGSLGYEYIGLSEHNPSISNHTKQEICSILEKRFNKIEQIKRSNKTVRIINLLEVDILSNGELAIDKKCMDFVDAIIVSIHSSFSMDKEKMTQRILKGFSHPKAKILAHPTGRILNERPGYEADWKQIFEFASKNKKALEINSSPTRLDLADVLVKEAKENCVKFVINTDSHEISQMDNMYYGVSVARRGWCGKRDVLNTLSYSEFVKWLKMY